VRAGQVCLDVGANLGAWVIQFAHWVGPTGRVLAFEPNPATQAVLAEHIRMNQLSNCTTIVPAAVGARAGTATFFASDVDGMSRIGSPNPHLQKTSQMLEVPVLTLDAYCAEQHLTPDWLFIDIEGYEAHALMGAEALIRHCGANLGIIVEMHPSLWSASNTTPNDFRALLARLERKAIPLTGQTDVFVDYGHVVLEPLTSETKIL
jgi:FkbM family methyltransferase